MRLADCIEEWAAEHRESGSHHPYKDAMLDLFELRFGDGREDGRDPQKFLTSAKRDFHRGRRDLIDALNNGLASGRVQQRDLPAHIQHMLTHRPPKGRK
jgi:hypothetical protein